MGGQPSHGGVPSVPGGGPNRTPLFVAMGVVAAAALVGALLVAGNGGDGDEDASLGRALPTTPSSSPAETTETTEDGEDGETTEDGDSDPTTTVESTEASPADDLEVVDKGFSNFPDAHDDGENRVSYGFVVQNNGDEPIADIAAQVQLFDEDDELVESSTTYIAVLNAGDRIGLSDEPYSDITEVTRMDVDLAASEQDEPPSSTGEITTSNIETANEGGYWTTTFEATSTYDEPVDSPYVYVIFRDAAGDIVGGTWTFMDIIPAGGTVGDEVTSFEKIPDVDPSRTEAYVDLGI